MKYNVIIVRKIAGELTNENFKDEKEMVEYFFTYLHCEDVESQLFWLNSLKDKIEERFREALTESRSGGFNC